MQPGIDELRPLADLAASVEKNFALPANGLLFERVVRSLEVLAWILRPTCPQNCAGGCPEIVRTEGRHRFGLVAHEGNPRAECAKLRRQNSRYAQCHLAFLHRQCVAADLEPAFFHLGPLAADMAGVERDL